MASSAVGTPATDQLESERRALAAEQARLHAEAEALQAERRQVKTELKFYPKENESDRRDGKGSHLAARMI